MNTCKIYDSAAIQNRIAKLTDGSAATLDEALDQWEATDAVFRQFQDTHDSTRILNGKLIKLLWLAEKALSTTQAESELFLSQSARDKIEQFAQALEATKSHYGSLREPPF